MMADVEERVASLAEVSVSDIAQRYKVGEEIGAGAQATVYRATHKKTGSKVAIKIIENNWLEDDEVYEALRMEIALLRQLKHVSAFWGTEPWMGLQKIQVVRGGVGVPNPYLHSLHSESDRSGLLLRMFWNAKGDV